MGTSEILYQAISSVQSADCAFCRYITGNDTGLTGSHQSGFYIPKPAARLLFEQPVRRGENADRRVEIRWQGDFVTQSRFVYYGKGTRDEFRITRFGRKFPFLHDENVGDLLVIARANQEYYKAFVLSADEDIDGFLSYFNLSPEDTNQLICLDGASHGDARLERLLNEFAANCVDFPETRNMARTARDAYNKVFGISTDDVRNAPDELLLKWVSAEYSLFQSMENKVYAPILQKPFVQVKDFIDAANHILNRRKSRAGKSLEHHLASVFDANGILYEEQAVTEGRKKPDFIFPNGACYHHFKFPSELLSSLAAKTTCKDRWRQVINEADRIGEKHLFTLQQGISANQLEEMKAEHVRLVVPRSHIKSFPEVCQPELMDLGQFVSFVREKQERMPRNFLQVPV